MSNMHFYNDDYEVELNDRIYHCCVEGTATSIHEPGTMYRRNGDPGDPPVDEFDVDSLEVSGIVEIDEDGNEMPVTDEDVRSEVESCVWDDLSDNEDMWSYDEDEPRQMDPWED